MDNILNISIDLVNDLEIRKRRGHEILGVCPICNCRDANFNVGKLTWRCWHCTGRGRIIAKEGYKIVEQPAPVLDIPKVRDLYSSFTKSCRGTMIQPVINYLKKRGLTDDTIDKFQLGFCSDDFYDEYSNSLAEDAGLVYQGYPILSNRAIIPYLVSGEVTDIRGRILDSCFTYKSNTPTYVGLSGSHSSRGATFLFNHDIISKSDRVILTEGEFKAIVANQFGFPVVATPGIFGWQKEWSKLLKDKEVILAADFDQVYGIRSPAYLMAKTISKELPKLKVTFLQWLGCNEKVDIDSLLLKEGGIRVFDKMIKAAINVEEWLQLEGRKGARRK